MITRATCVKFLTYFLHVLLTTASVAFAAPAAPPNVLFIIADDQNTRLGCYGDRFAKTPNLDKLAGDGVLFTNAYCQQPLCGPSRASLLTGLRPDSVKVYDLHTTVREHNPHVVTLPQDFKNRGYFSQAIGKVFHPGIDDPQSWSIETFEGPEIVGSTSQTSGTVGGLPAVNHGKAGGKRGPSWFAPDLPEEKFHDGVITRKAIHALNQLKDRPFFLAVGYNRPHLPFVAPRKYFEQFNESELPDTIEPADVLDAPTFAHGSMAELRQYRDIPSTGPLSLEKARELTRAYYACTSFVDAQVGILLKELERLQLDDNTIVVFLGDHGFHLGENSTWAKNVNYEAATRAPLLIRVPGCETTGSLDQVVEFVDIYPTLAELCGWSPKGVAGESLATCFHNGSQHAAMHALQNHPSESQVDVALSQVHRRNAIGYSLRSPKYRYTEWRSREGKILARELYRYDGSRIETRNEAHEPGNKALVEKMHQQIDQLKGQ